MATMASMPLAVDLGSSAGAYAGGLLDPGELARIAHDLRQMKRSRIEGPNVPRARAVLVPLCHDARGVPHALFTVEPDDFGAPHVSFPGAPISRTIRPRDAPAVSAAMRDACDALGLDDDAFGRLEILGMTSDCPDVPRQTAVTPVVGYLGELDVDALCAGNAEGNGGGTRLMAMSLEDLLSEESVDARVVPGVGPVPVFNASCPPERPLQIWGITAQILHGVMRVVVGARAEYAKTLYAPFMRKSRGGGEPGGERPPRPARRFIFFIFIFLNRGTQSPRRYYSYVAYAAVLRNRSQRPLASSSPTVSFPHHRLL